MKFFPGRGYFLSTPSKSGVLLLLTCLPMAQAHATPPDCEKNKAFPVMMISEQKTAGKIASIYGVFELSNRGKTPVVFDTMRSGGMDSIEYPAVDVQREHANGVWNHNMLFTGSFALGPDRLVVPPNASKRFKVDLTGASNGDIPGNGLATSHYRITLRSLSPDMCIISETFSLPPS